MTDKESVESSGGLAEISYACCFSESEAEGEGRVVDCLVGGLLSEVGFRFGSELEVHDGNDGG